MSIASPAAQAAMQSGQGGRRVKKNGGVCTPPLLASSESVSGAAQLGGSEVRGSGVVVDGPARISVGQVADVVPVGLQIVMGFGAHHQYRVVIHLHVGGFNDAPQF